MVETREGSFRGSEPCPARVSLSRPASPGGEAAAAGGRWGGAPLRGRRVPAVSPALRRARPAGSAEGPAGRALGCAVRAPTAPRPAGPVGGGHPVHLVSVPVFHKLTTVVVLASYRSCFNGRTGVAEEGSREKHPAACPCSTVPSLMKESVCQHPLVKTALILRVQYFLRAVSYSSNI